MLAACAALVLLVVAACAPEVHEPAPMAPVAAPPGDDAPSADSTPDDVAADAAPSAPDEPEVAAPVRPPAGPQWPSVAWILTQAYETPTPYEGVACGRGQQAFDSMETLFLAHPDTGRCSFRCIGKYADHTAECETIDGYCDAAGWCRSIHVPE